MDVFCLKKLKLQEPGVAVGETLKICFNLNMSEATGRLIAQGKSVVILRRSPFIHNGNAFKQRKHITERPLPHYAFIYSISAAFADLFTYTYRLCLSSEINEPA